jgi:hypothetical protein
VVAPFGDLEVADVRRVAEVLTHAGMARRGIVDEPPLRQGGHQRVEVVEPEEEIHVGHLLSQLVLVALHQTADGDHRLDVARLFQIGGVQDGLDRFALRGVDEPTRIHEHDIGRTQVPHDLGTVPYEVAYQTLRVDGRLVTAEGDDAEFHRD